MLSGKYKGQLESKSRLPLIGGEALGDMEETT